MNEEVSALVALASDVIDHGHCEGCKVNAADGLAELGLLENALAAAGAIDPRVSARRSLAEHEMRPSGSARDRAESITLTVVFSLPSEPTPESARRRIAELSAVVTEALASEGAVVTRVHTVGERPANWGKPS